MCPRERIHHTEKTDVRHTAGHKTSQYAPWGVMDTDPKLQAFKSSSRIVVTRAATREIVVRNHASCKVLSRTSTRSQLLHGGYEQFVHHHCPIVIRERQGTPTWTSPCAPAAAWTPAATVLHPVAVPGTAAPLGTLLRRAASVVRCAVRPR